MTSETPETSGEPQPLPGDQVPAAVLPASEYGLQAAGPNPGGPLPVTPAAKPRNRPLIVLGTLAAAFFLGMGAFLTLWLAERDDHNTTGQQLEAVRGDLGTARKAAEDSAARYSEAESDRKRLQTNLERMSPCAQAAKEFQNSFPVPGSGVRASIEDVRQKLDAFLDTPCW